AGPLTPCGRGPTKKCWLALRATAAPPARQCVPKAESSPAVPPAAGRWQPGLAGDHALRPDRPTDGRVRVLSPDNDRRQRHIPAPLIRKVRAAAAPPERGSVCPHS